MDAEIRPLRLVDLQPADAIERARRLSLRFAPVNLTASPVPGIGGIGLFALMLLMSVLAPVLWVVLLSSALCGIGLGAVMIAVRR